MCLLVNMQFRANIQLVKGHYWGTTGGPLAGLQTTEGLQKDLAQPAARCPPARTELSRHNVLHRHAIGNDVVPESQQSSGKEQIRVVYFIFTRNNNNDNNNNNNKK